MRGKKRYLLFSVFAFSLLIISNIQFAAAMSGPWSNFEKYDECSDLYDNMETESSIHPEALSKTLECLSSSWQRVMIFAVLVLIVYYFVEGVLGEMTHAPSMFGFDSTSVAFSLLVALISWGYAPIRIIFGWMLSVGVWFLAGSAVVVFAMDVFRTQEEARGQMSKESTRI